VLRLSALFAAILALSAIADDKPAAKVDRKDPPPGFPGPTKDGFLLPNGWHLTPVGRHVEITDLRSTSAR
jgi:hypothetical protein